MRRRTIISMFIFMAMLFSCNAEQDNKQPITDGPLQSTQLENVEQNQDSLNETNLAISVKDEQGTFLSGVKIKINRTLTKQNVVPLPGGMSATVFSFKRYETDSTGQVSIENLPMLFEATHDESGSIVNPHVNGASIESVENVSYTISALKPGYDIVSKSFDAVYEPTTKLDFILKKQDSLDLKIALLDYEPQYRGSEFLIRNRIGFSDISGQLDNMSDIDANEFKILAVGMQASKYEQYFSDFLGLEPIFANGQKIKRFLDAGGTLFFFPQDNSEFLDPVTFFSQPNFLTNIQGALEAALQLDVSPFEGENPGNDYLSGSVLDNSHILVQGLGNPIKDEDLIDWFYNDPDRPTTSLRFVGSDVMKPDRPGWTAILGTPGADNEQNAKGSVAINSYVLAAEASMGQGTIFICQIEYYRATYSPMAVSGAQKVANNIVTYLKQQAAN